MGAEARYASVNGWMVYASGGCHLLPGKCSIFTISVNEDVLKMLINKKPTEITLNVFLDLPEAPLYMTENDVISFCPDSTKKGTMEKYEPINNGIIETELFSKEISLEMNK